METRTARAKRRARKAQARRPSSVVASKILGALGNATPLTEAEEFSVCAELAKAYLPEADEFLARRAQGPEVKSIDLKDPDRLDVATVRYRALLRAPRRAVRPPVTMLPTVGFRPLVIRLPMVGGHVGDEPRGYMKEQQPLELTKEKVFEPRGRRSPRSAVVYHPLSKAQTSKSGTTNDTVTLALDGKAGYVFAKTSTALHAAARLGKFLFALLTLATCERARAESARRYGLSELGLASRSRRHGAASHALRPYSLVEKKLQVRIRVKCAEIVRLYKKTGKLQRLVEAMGRDRCWQTEALLQAADATPNPFLALVDKLKILRARPKAHDT